MLNYYEWKAKYMLLIWKNLKMYLLKYQYLSPQQNKILWLIENYILWKKYCFQSLCFPCGKNQSLQGPHEEQNIPTLEQGVTCSTGNNLVPWKRSTSRHPPPATWAQLGRKSVWKYVLPWSFSQFLGNSLIISALLSWELESLYNKRETS